ncbi:hypothetical protein UA08_02217 [Talaromyces atroroseus]|uniref:Uncharacterized protein n=1 Tax=Talaromyces atroroseus TaxID=1441469 RepID=A0A225ALK7_TALAT|nr:hypothetical protein UA08_02217 [Talaromyces atroroseus]OKL61790.1 hypothetical protein UA08_02217 [Talaromyces atroroseus]
MISGGLTAELIIGSCISLYIWLDVVNHEEFDFSADPPAVDWSDSGSPLGANGPSSLAYFVGMNKCTRSFGVCIPLIVAGQLSLQFGLYVLGSIGLFWIPLKQWFRVSIPNDPIRRSHFFVALCLETRYYTFYSRLHFLPLLDFVITITNEKKNHRDKVTKNKAKNKTTKNLNAKQISEEILESSDDSSKKYQDFEAEQQGW